MIVELVLDSSSSSSAGASRSIVGNRCDVFDPSDSETGSCQHSDCCLRSGSGSSCLVSAGCPDSNMECGYSSVFGDSCCSGCRLHCSVRRALKSVCFHMLASGTT